MRSRVRLSAAVPAVATFVVALLVLAGVTASAGPDRSPVAPVVHGAHDDTSTPFTLVDVPALVRHRADGRDLSLDRLLDRTARFDRWAISYRGDGLRLTGALTLPRGGGRHPVVVVAHGFALPGRYTLGSGTSREERRLGEQGFVVLHPDYRNWGGSDVEAGTPVAHPLGYPEDLLDAVVALRRARLPQVDLSRTALLGRSMGGGVALQAAVARPGWFRGLLLYSSVSADAAANARRWVRPGTALAARVRASYGTSRTRPALWHAASVSSYLDRLGTMPVSIHHGTADRICPIGWSERTATELRAQGTPVATYAYRGERHHFERRWPVFMDRTSAFFRTVLR
ncbi:peptidase [Marmoricola endophyticus]|uniref:Peptidase n=1 Tax=Marmoricola endophyticus TaxID=2040280 RepID=A0A917BTX8_9ACTN|nr:alpha/beta hydrolase [Marmoricola endophyticus]GGF58611.1 peptidase [Marmoricola endophyticus]